VHDSPSILPADDGASTAPAIDRPTLAMNNVAIAIASPNRLVIISAIIPLSYNSDIG
jgi:hypothetical protein